MKQDIITETVRKWLAEGRFQPGEQLPTDAELAKIFNVNKCTVGAGLRQLVEEKILERAPKRGTIVKRPDTTIPITNAVALITLNNGIFFSGIVRKINENLHQNGLYPVLINSDLVDNTKAVEEFLEQMTRQSRPYGYLILGDGRFPYEILMKKIYLKSRIVFFHRYHWYEKFPNCRYVLSDYEILSQQIVEYFAAKGMKRIFFAAKQEENYSGEWSSMQVTIMKSIRRQAEKHGLLFDEGLFWCLHSGAPIEEILPIRWKDDIPTGIYAWLDDYLKNVVMPLPQKLGKIRGKDYEFLGTYDDMEILKKEKVDSFDFHTDEIVKTAVEMLTGQNDQKDILVSPTLVRYSDIQKKGGLDKQS